MWRSAWCCHLLDEGLRGQKHTSYRVQDSVEVHETDGDRDGLQEDRRERDEPQTLERDGNGHITAVEEGRKTPKK